MDIKTSVFKRAARLKKIKLKDGSVKDTRIAGGWVYRLRYVDDDGRNRTVERGPYIRKWEAENARNTKLAEIDQTSGNIQNGEKMTFNRLAAICKAEIYHNKATSNLYIVNTLCLFFGERRIGAIDRGLIEAYIHWRITADPKDELKSIVKRSSVDRELRIMRSMIYHAIDEGWIIKNPFRPSKKLKPLINKAKGERMRTLSPDEEFQLLPYCEPGARDITYTRKFKGVEREETMNKETGNEWLKAIVLCALDAGMRRREILELRRTDLDLADLMISLPAALSKTRKVRRIGISDRLAVELRRILPLSDGEHIFPMISIDRAFNTAVRLAKLKDFTFRDLRRTFDTRQREAGGDLLATSEVAGHSPEVALEHYVKTGDSSARTVRDQVNAINQRNNDLYENKKSESGFIN
ncbi:MAG TPA: tyrosine-type recombinase/integrase [Pyrinomonadaceae bacterium]|jgi:integrase|nr:tyrosine-type recombinase/integrase [Pyrinomonadaceae bacterium]